MPLEIDEAAQSIFRDGRQESRNHESHEKATGKDREHRAFERAEAGTRSLSSYYVGRPAIARGIRCWSGFSTCSEFASEAGPG